MTQQLSFAGKISASAKAVKLVTVCADVRIIAGEGQDVMVSAQTPAFWQVEESGNIVEVGGPVAEALRAPGDPLVSRFGGSVSIVNIGSGFVNGAFYVNNRQVEVPTVREQAVISLPAGFTGDVEVEADYFGKHQIDASLRGKVKIKVSSRVTLKLADQETLSAASLEASTGASIEAGALVAEEGRVKLSASNSGSSLEVGAIKAGRFAGSASTGAKIFGHAISCAGNVDLEASNSGSMLDFEDVRCTNYSVEASTGAKIKNGKVRCTGDAKLSATNSGSIVQVDNVSAATVNSSASNGGKVRGKHVGAREAVAFKSSNSGSLVEMEAVWTSAAKIDASMSGTVELGNLDAYRLKADAGMSSRITVANGSAEEGSASASMSARVTISGDFGTVTKKESMSGKVGITLVRGDAFERLSRAGKRNFNTDLADDLCSMALASSFTEAMGPAMKAGLGEALDDENFVTVVCKAIGPSYRDEAVVTAVRAAGAALKEAIGSTDNLVNPDLVGAAMQSPAVAEPYAAAFQLFLGTVFTKAESLLQ